MDVLEALSSTCTLYTQSSIGLMQLLSDMLVAFLLITAHGSVLMCQVGVAGARGRMGLVACRVAVPQHMVLSVLTIYHCVAESLLCVDSKADSVTLSHCMRACLLGCGILSHAMSCCAALCAVVFARQQAMVFAVTMNSKRNALLALMIATNFVELKGQVYKRTDTNKLWALACQVRDCCSLDVLQLHVTRGDACGEGCCLQYAADWPSVVACPGVAVFV